LGFLINRAYHGDWTTLRGCISPANQYVYDFSRIDKKGVTFDEADSISAMEEIFSLLGGYKEGKVISLLVENNVPGINSGPLNKNAWLRSRKHA